MSTPIAVGHEIPRSAARRLLIAVTLALVLGAGIVTAYVLTSSASPAPAAVPVEETRAGAASCTDSHPIAGGTVEGLSAADTCGAAGGTTRSGGVQP